MAGARFFGETAASHVGVSRCASFLVGLPLSHVHWQGIPWKRKSLPFDKRIIGKIVPEMFWMITKLHFCSMVVLVHNNTQK